MGFAILTATKIKIRGEFIHFVERCICILASRPPVDLINRTLTPLCPILADRLSAQCLPQFAIR